MKEKFIKTLQTLMREALAIEVRKKDKRYEYPETIAECLDDEMKYRPGVYEAMKKFRQSQPWRGTQVEMQSKFRALNEELAKVYKIVTPQLVFVDKFPVGACCFPHSKPAVIMMEPENDGRYSVVVYLHEFGHCLNKDEHGAVKWSVNLFRKIFQNSYNKLDHKGHLLVRKK